MAHRLQYRFWLNADKDDELLLTSEIDSLKRDRSFVGTIRDGLRLMLDLRQGRVGVLFELFPWIKDELPAPPDDKDDLKKEINYLKELMLSQYKSDGGMKMVSVGGPKPLSTGGPKLLMMKAAPPVAFDDDEPLVIRKDESSGLRAAQNMINSMLALNGEQPMFKS